MDTFNIYSLWLIIALQLILIFVILISVKSKYFAQGTPPGLNIPSTIVKDSNNESQPLYQILSKSKVNLVCFVANGCRFCEKIIPEIEKLKERNPDIQVTLLLHKDERNSENLINRTKTILPSYNLTGNEGKKLFKINIYPFGVLTNERGVILKRGIMTNHNLLSWTIDMPEAIGYLKEQERVLG
ncbi:thiol-disulfide isomerase/thioredoxin [Paenibacillus phyllosphaerae]|uniref:Thiol-disulfide isomerase/thioredoxin n=1 Tax=Paenibacillus phyllosphaerae TaxID=274593 RepID=A0A7W5B1I8_9BACL|nr:thioredoxin family protein [Paenibacillus phyllosphaerae]MBB3111981.1 thiol-disulfide isomerase/thioredoxin [Paenibacillus phyllosphaerae]